MLYGKLDANHKVIITTPLEAEQLLANLPARLVGDFTRQETRVSTVFLVINHGFHGENKWFETMVFGGDLDGEQDRYTTWEEAEHGHAAMVARVLALKNSRGET
jgi:hypothetical protein